MSEATEREITVEQIRKAGGIVHSDGNIFFTNIDHLRAALSGAEQVVARDLHAAIMNIPTPLSIESWNATRRYLYKSGHRDARHAAAELALASQPVAAAPVGVRESGVVHSTTAASETVPGDGWQPIETAPKDGTFVLGCFWNEELPNHYMPKTIVWAAYHPNAKGEMCWRDAHVCGNKMKNVTHWKPRPAPPESSGADNASPGTDEKTPASAP